MPNININRRIVLSGLNGVSYDSSAIALFNAMSTPPSAAEKGYINTYILALKGYGIWTKLDFLQVYAQATQQAGNLNWINPALYTAVPYNSATWTAYQGYTGNSSNMYVDTGYNPATNGVNYLQNSACHFIYQRLNVGTSTTYACGSRTPASAAGTSTNLRWTDNKVYSHVNAATSAGLLNFLRSDARGFFNFNRSASNASQMYINGTSVSTSSEASAAILSSNDFVLARGSSGVPEGYSSIQASIRGYGGSLDATEQANFYIATQAYMTAIGSQV